MKGKLKKLLCGALSAAVILSSLPAVVFAVEGNTGADTLPEPIVNITFDETEADKPYTLEGGASTAVGRSGNALSLTGDNQYAELNITDKLKTLNGDFTISVWANADADRGWSRIYDLGSGDTTYAFLSPHGYNPDATRFAMKKSNADGETECQLNASSILSAGKWHNIVVTRKDGVSTMYIDGLKDAVTEDIPYNFSDLGYLTNCYLGKSQFDDPYFDGMIDDFAIYDQALNIKEVREIAAESFEQELESLDYADRYIADTHFYRGENGDREVFSYELPPVKTLGVADLKYDEQSKKASFTLKNATINNNDKLTAYVAEYAVGGMLKKVVPINLDEKIKAHPTVDEVFDLPVEIDFEKSDDSDTVKVLVWNDMTPVPPATDNETPTDMSDLKVNVSVDNYTALNGEVSATLIIDDGGYTRPLGDITEKIENLASLDSGEITMTIPYVILSENIGSSAKRIVLRLTVPTADGSTKTYDAATLYCGVKSPVAAPADSDTTTNGAHDPSIVKFPNDPLYYVYSSHHLIFTSEDLINWKKYDFSGTHTTNPDFTEGNGDKLNANEKMILDKTYSYMTANGYTNVNATYWAPDVIYRPDDMEHPYWMYISVSCGLGDMNSVISLVKSSSPLFWADPGANIEDAGVIFATKKNNGKTNSIDANIYVDSKGTPDVSDDTSYFIWGSFWGGIQVAPLNAEGRVDGVTYDADGNATLSSTKNFGTSVFTQKNGVAGPEGAWMIEHGGNRYMFTSYGWLGSNYNTRAARSALTTEFNTTNGWNLTDANNVTMYNQQSAGSTSKTTGYKLIGSYRLGDGAMEGVADGANYSIPYSAGDAITYYGPGHNSAIETEDGESFYISHTRVGHVEGAATLQVRKMLWTADGWPVVSPVTYAGEVEQTLPEDMIVGTYDLASVGQTKMIGASINTGDKNHLAVNRNYDLPVLSSKISLNDDGAMTDVDGGALGTWEFDNDHTVTLKFTKNGDASNNKDEFYKNGDTMTLYALFGYDKDERTPVVGLTGTDQNHVTQLAKKELSNTLRTDKESEATPQPEAVPIEVEKSAGGNPIIRADGEGNMVYTGDPAAMVDGDTVYLYVGHDAGNATSGYQMPDYLCYSSKDMVNWKYESTPFAMSETSWSGNHNSSWAGQVVKHGDKYYYYFCTPDSTSNGKFSIGVAVSDTNSPTGHFTPKSDPLVKGTLTEPQAANHDDIDPTILIDTVNGEEHIYLCWGNTNLYMCELNSDMVSVKDIDDVSGISMNGDIKEMTFNASDGGTGFVMNNFGTNRYTEAPYLYKHGNLYYLFFAANYWGDVGEEMAYATASDPWGPWEFGGVIMKQTATSNTNHPSVIDFGEKTYFIYHNGSLPGGTANSRSVCVTDMEFNEDGSIDMLEELSTGLTGTTSYITQNNNYVTHDAFTNTLNASNFPVNVDIGVGVPQNKKDISWEITPGLSDETDEYLVSLQSVNKPGCYITATDSDVKLRHDQDGTLKAQMTFKTFRGIGGTEDAVSFESVAKPGYYLTNNDGNLVLTDGKTDAANCDFLIGDTFEIMDNLASIENSRCYNNKVQFHLVNAAIYGKVYVKITEMDAEENIIGDTDDPTELTVNSVNQIVTIPYTMISEISDHPKLKIEVYYDADCTKPAVIDYVRTFEQPRIPDGYTSYFEFEDNLKDTKAAVADGTVVPANIEGTTTATAAYEDGYSGKAVSFTGAGGTGVNLGKVITDSKYTIAFRMKANAFTQHTSGIFINSGTKTNENWVSAPFGSQTDGNAAFWSNNATAATHHVQSSGGKFLAGTWHHVALTADGGTASLYIDGAKVVDKGAVINTVSADTETYLGVNFWDTPFNGLIDDLYIYNGKTLSDYEVENLFAATSTSS